MTNGYGVLNAFKDTIIDHLKAKGKDYLSDEAVYLVNLLLSTMWSVFLLKGNTKYWVDFISSVASRTTTNQQAQTINEYLEKLSDEDIRVGKNNQMVQTHHPLDPTQPLYQNKPPQRNFTPYRDERGRIGYRANNSDTQTNFVREDRNFSISDPTSKIKMLADKIQLNGITPENILLGCLTFLRGSGYNSDTLKDIILDVGERKSHNFSRNVDIVTNEPVNADIEGLAEAYLDLTPEQRTKFDALLSDKLGYRGVGVFRNTVDAYDKRTLTNAERLKCTLSGVAKTVLYVFIALGMYNRLHSPVRVEWPTSISEHNI